MRKIYTSLIALAFVFCGLVFSAHAGTDGHFDETMKVLIVGSPEARTSSVIAEILASKGAAPIVLVSDEDDALAANAAQIPIIANQNRIIPIRAAAVDLDFDRTKTETLERGVSNFTKREFYHPPPNDYGYNGISFGNRIRARPQNC